ncbi:YcaO-like family protein [Neorhizobium alkalisoli]|uniref:Ribosomal protein S12 methylthiotransferase accessory factor n=1 Tax=Neorhizobium alkalisoli TaxID=528178 RepID=A0A561Q0W9_9HYPH|nr:YcaO-like family protein [Neorhizobium alkalisoli]TWF44026.1 ribosomal protein S12 methylthiotransferase accessory factor [Neorhizobium alkalisoli]
MNTTLRKCPPGETFDNVSPHLSRLGITRVARQTGLDRIGIPVWCAYNPNAKAIVIAQGKGADDDTARTSAVMEAVERAVATVPTCIQSKFSASALQSMGQRYDCLNDLLASGAQPIEDDETLVWTTARDLGDDGQVWVPYDAVHLDRTGLSPRFWLSSDGLASGNDWHEATLHGLLERIERDATTLWNIEGMPQRLSRRIDPRDISDDAVAGMLDALHRAGFDIAIFDITTDLAIPCAAALLRPAGQEKAPRHVDVTFGAGAALALSQAVYRAIAEAVQSRMTFIAGARDDLVPGIFAKLADPDHLAAFNAPFASGRRYAKGLSAESSKQALENLVKSLAASGITRLYAVDLTPDWLPVSVVKVLAPQLEKPEGDRRNPYGARALSKALS